MNAFDDGPIGRRLFEMEQLAQGPRPLSVCQIEVNGLSLLNATRGRKAGDALLSSVELALRRGTRKATDSVFALGGDELAVLLVGATRIQALRAVRRIFAQPLVASVWSDVALGVSVGIVQFSREQTAAEVVALADSAMCAAKRASRAAATIGRDATSVRLALRSLPETDTRLEASITLVAGPSSSNGAQSCLAS